MKDSFKIIIVFFFSLLISLNTFAQNDMESSAAKAYNEGNKLLKAGDYEGAAKQYKEGLKTSKDYRIYYQLGVTLKKQGKSPEAEEAFRSSIQSNPNFDIAYNGLGGIYFQEGKYAEAAEAFKKFEQLTEKKSLKDQAKEYVSRSLVKLGENAKKEGNYSKALEYLNEATKYSELDAAYVMLSITHYENGDYDKTLAVADQVLNIKTSRLKGAAYYYKGMAFKQKQDIEKAKQFFEESKKDPQYKRLAEYELNLLK